MFDHLCDPDAAPAARRLYRLLCSISGRAILAGQQESTRDGTQEEMQYIEEVTGELPCIRGFDYIDDDFEGVNRRAAAWYARGGIVSICWHWGAPPHGLGYESSKGKIDVIEALTPGTALHSALLDRMDEVAKALKALAEQGIPVLWRPLHEFDGGWFWWSKGGAKAFIRLWRLMVERFTREHGLHNLIWVLGYSHRVRRGWFPGEDVVDIAGVDYYGRGTQKRRYRKANRQCAGRKPLCFHECGVIPDPVRLQREGPPWLWFLTWHTKHIKRENTREGLKAVYSNPYVITLRRLPAVWDLENKGNASYR